VSVSWRMWNEQRFLTLDPEQLEWLHQQERVWFAWVCRLHDMHSSTQAPHSATVLAIAQRRWTEARRALERAAQQEARAQRPGRPPNPSVASATKRPLVP